MAIETDLNPPPRQDPDVNSKTWREWFRLLHGLVQELIGLVRTMLTPYREVGLASGNTASYSDGDTITNYAVEAVVAPASNNPTQLAVDDVAGSITVAIAGWYSVAWHVVGAGSNNNKYYGVRARNAGTGNTRLLGTAKWGNNHPGMVFSGTIAVKLAVGDVITLEAIAEAGTLTLDEAELSLKMEWPI